MPNSLLRSILTTPLHSKEAIPLGGAVGAGVGAGLSLAFRGCANVATDALIGVWMGIGWTNVERFLDPDRTLTPLQEHELALVDYPGVRQILRDAGTSVNDLGALQALAVDLEQQITHTVTQFNDYCHSRGIPPNPLMRGVIRHFFLTNCSQRTVMLLSNVQAMDCYLVAAHPEQREVITRGLNQPHIPAGTVLRQLHCPYLRVDLANSALRDARAFSTDECDGEMRVHSVHTMPGETLETVQPSGPATLTRRRVKPQHRAADDSPAAKVALPDLVPTAHQMSKRIERGPLLREKLAGLKPDSRTWRELERIEQDLTAGRPCGHLVRWNGVLCHAIDIHWEGRLSPGRNAWRLLYDGRQLVDIVDYHRPRS